MNKSKFAAKLALLGLAVGGLGVANAASVDGTATAKVISPLTVVETTPLNFGTLALIDNLSAGTVAVDAAGAATPGNVELLSGTGLSAATFTIGGEPNTNISVSLTSGGAQLDDGSAGGGGAPMTLTGFTNSGLPTVTGSAPGGVVSFTVGATLNVNANQTPASYSTATGDGAPYSVTVNYN